jgi:ferric iron reductase protein FhuF
MSGLDATFRTVAATVDYLRASTSAPTADGWWSCADAIADPDRLHDQIVATAEDRGAHDEQVAASLFVQGYAFRVPSIAVAAFALGLDRPSLDPETTAFRIDRSRPAAVAHLDPEPAGGDLATELVAHLAALIDAVRSTITVGDRLLWGNSAASIATIFRAVEGAVADDATRSAIRTSAVDLFADADAQLGGLGSFEVVDRGWFWARGNCCLWYQTSGGRMCDDCSLLDPDVRRAQWRAQLAEAAP